MVLLTTKFAPDVFQSKWQKCTRILIWKSAETIWNETMMMQILF